RMSEEVQKGEADRVARKRFAFQRANKEVMKDPDQLAAYAAVYANMSTLGCVYPPEVMRRIEMMSADVEESAVDGPELRSLVLASRGRAHAAKQKQENEDTNEQRQNNNGRHILSEMRENLLMSHREASGLEMIDWASKRLQLQWNMADHEGETRVYIARILVLNHRFVHSKNVKEMAVNAVVDAFLEGGTVTIDGSVALFKGRRPQFTFIDSVTRNLNKAAKNAKLTAGKVTKTIMESVFDDVNLPFEIITKHLQGWEQQVEVRSAELLLAQKTLKKGECVKAKMDAAIDEMCEELSGRLTSSPIRLDNSHTGLKLL
ncbi:hypothetical protein PENTCL1PPCAC_22431, partial [Pristionchus entomophagus]